MMGTSVYPYVYVDEEVPVHTLKNVLLGYLKVTLGIGTPEQVYNFNHERGKRNPNIKQSK